MRTCAKLRCDAEPDSTVILRYDTREIMVGELLPERDPNLLELCHEHVARLTPPVGWIVRDVRVAVPTA